MIDINEYLTIFTGRKTYDKIGETELNKILLNSITDVRSKKPYVQGFECETINFKRYVNMSRMSHEV